MELRRVMEFALAVFVTVGLAVAPLTTPASAARVHTVGMTDLSMSGDMPCCPDEQKSKDCQDCPLVAICLLKTVQAGPSVAAAPLIRHAILTAHSLSDDTHGDGLNRPPPDHPPRSLI